MEAPELTPWYFSPKKAAQGPARIRSTSVAKLLDPSVSTVSSLFDGSGAKT